jgi:hypothetical protein
VELGPIIKEAQDSLPPDTVFPQEIGGDEVKLLIGIKLTQLAPRLIATLPSGVSIFESKVTDVFGSNICFGGPHEVFTEAYRLLGTHFQTSSIQSLQTLFTEVASAYKDSPWVFVRDDQKSPSDPKILFESCHPEASEFALGMVDIALETSPELMLHQPATNPVSGLGEQLNLLDGEEESHLHFEGPASSNPSLDADTSPEVYVMTSACYGVSSTGNQADEVRDRLLDLYAEELPLAVGPLFKDHYMDDMDSGATGGLTTKFDAHSDEIPPEKATVDRGSVGVIRMKSLTKTGGIALNLQPMNLEKKICGAKKTAEDDVTTPQGLQLAFKKGIITRAAVLRRIAAGWFEPFKLQRKILMTSLKST